MRSWPRIRHPGRRPALGQRERHSNVPDRGHPRYTRYTHEHGDEAGSTLASAFAGIVRASVTRIIATDAKYAWVLTDTAVRQVSLSNGRTIGRIPFGSADWLAAGAGGLWVTENEQGVLRSLLYRINPSSLDEKRVEVPGNSA